MNTFIGKPIEILLVEDSPGDVRLTREALKEGKMLNTLNVVKDGVEAIDYLRRKEPFTRAVRPDLILLDLNLPRKNGVEVLAEIKNDPDLKRIPVVILTVSQSDEDIVKSYNFHANCFISKPVEYVKFIGIIKAIEDFWLTIVTLPQEEHGSR